MKKNPVEVIKHANAVLIVVFCVLYSLMNSSLSIGAGLIVCAAALFFLYIADMMTFPGLSKGDKRNSRKFSIIAGWFFAFWLFALITESDALKIMSGALFIVAIICFVFDVRKLSREHFNLGLVLRGEIRYLEDIEEYIQKTYISSNHVELIDLVYSKEHLRIVNESEWRSLAESKERRLPTQLREKGPSREQVTFSCLLHGKWRYLEAIRTHIADYLSDGKIESLDLVYSMDRLYIASESE